MRSTNSVPLAAALVTYLTFASAKTDLTGCTTTDVSSPAGASVAWYVPGTYELCDPLDCGGGRAPPKTTVPGCPLYTGTETYSPSYLAGYGPATQTAAPSVTGSSVSASEMAPMTTSAAASSSSSSFDWASLESQAETSESSWDLYTDSTNAMTSTTAAASSGVAVVTGVISSSEEQQSMTLTSTPSMSSAAYSNGTLATGTPNGGSNGTTGNVTSGAPTASQTISEGGAVATAGAWAGGLGLVAGLGALVAVL